MGHHFRYGKTRGWPYPFSLISISTPRAHGLEDLLVASLIDLDSNRWHSEALRNLFMQSDNSLILHIYIIIRKHYHTYFELIHAFYS